MQAPQTKEDLIRELQLQRATEEATAKKKLEEQRLLVKQKANTKTHGIFLLFQAEKTKAEKTTTDIKTDKHTVNTSPNPTLWKKQPGSGRQGFLPNRGVCTRTLDKILYFSFLKQIFQL